MHRAEARGRTIGGRVASGIAAPLVLVIALAAFVLGATLAIGGAAIHRWITDDSRPGLALVDVVRADLPGFASAAAPSDDACGDRRGCIEAVVGDGVAIYRYATLDLARQSVSHGDADAYRSDRLVLELGKGLTADERLVLIQNVEGTWTGSSD